MQQGHPLAFLNRALGPRWQKIYVYEKELLVVVTAVQKWEQYLSSGQQFIIRTDQKKAWNGYCNRKFQLHFSNSGCLNWWTLTMLSLQKWIWECSGWCSFEGVSLWDVVLSIVSFRLQFKLSYSKELWLRCKSLASYLSITARSNCEQVHLYWWLVKEES